MLPAEVEVASVAAARQVLDRFGLASRLEHVRQFVWRGGALRLQVDDASVWYELSAQWETAVLESVDVDAQAPALVPARAPTIEGRWTRATTGYVLRAGIDLGVPSAIFIRSERWSSFVPFVNRTAWQVEQALNADLTAYVNVFLNGREPVPRAEAAGAARLRQLGL